MLGRSADDAGLSAWNQALAAGASRGDVAVGFTNSAEAKQHWFGVTSLGIFAHDPNSAIVREDYQTAFGREADSPGLAFWTSVLRSGQSVGQLAQDLSLSAEFQSMHGQQSDADYINSLYVNGLGRPAEAAGTAAWVSALQTGTSRADVLTAIAQSPEGQQHLQWALSA